MDESKDAVFVAEKLELYSNAIVAFSVIQSLGYAFYFGNDCEFNTTIKTATFLAEFLFLMFLLVGGLGAYAVARIGRQLMETLPSQGPILRKVGLAKVFIVVLFTSLPVFLTLAYAIIGSEPNAVCMAGGSAGLSENGRP